MDEASTRWPWQLSLQLSCQMSIPVQRGINLQIKLGLWTGRQVHVSHGGGEARHIAQLTEAEVLAPASDPVPLSDVLALIKGKALGHVDLERTRHEVEIADVWERALGPDGLVLATMDAGL
jgi:hypothetical protein